MATIIQARPRRVSRENAPRTNTARARHRLLRELVHDPYRRKSKLHEPTVCPRCSAVYQAGRWQWAARPHDAVERLCPACRRTRDRYPAGFLHISGRFLDEHERDVMNVIHNVEAHEKREHPMVRLVAVERRDGELLVTTTEARLARAIGLALQRAHEGELAYHYVEESPLLDVFWKR